MEAIVVIPLFVLMRSDYRTREVDLLWLLIFTALQLALALLTYGSGPAMMQMLGNLLILFSLFAGVRIYIRRKRKDSVLKNYIGCGDLIFLCALTPVFSSVLFLRFLVISFTFSLVWWGIQVWFRKTKVTIPLVTTVGLCYTIVLMWNFLIG